MMYHFFIMRDNQELYIKQVMVLLKNKSKNNYCALLGIGLCLDLSISDNNDKIKIVRNLTNRGITDMKTIKEFVFPQWNGDEVIN